LQTFKNFGIQTLLTKYLKDSFKHEFGDLRLSSEILANTDLMNKIIENSRITEVAFIQTEMPSALEDEIYPDKNTQKHKAGKLKVSIHAEYGRSLPLHGKVAGLLSGKLKPNQLLRIENVNPDQVSVKFDFNGRPRTLTCGSGIDMRPVLDITDEVDLRPDGNPVFEDLDREAVELLRMLLKQDSEGKIK
jgi:hypothetical protein